jgi:HSP20 family protein
MLPVRWEPFRGLGRELSTLHREMDELFRKTFGLTSESAFERGMLTPVVNTFMEGKNYCGSTRKTSMSASTATF